jgi:cobalt-precorrin 5A hydrolase
MRYVIFSFTAKAATLSSQLHKNIVNNNDCCTSYTTIKSELPPNLTKLNSPLKEQIKELFHHVDAIIFVSACAIAVRSIAPFLESKTTDPAVIVIDELGQYAISLLSGHIGGGNELTKQVADWIGATPIISTATDLNNLFAVDVFATKNNMYIDNMILAKQVSSELLDNKDVGVSSDFPITSQLPTQLILNYDYSHDQPHNSLPIQSTNNLPLGIAITLDENKSIFDQTLHLIPRIITLGIGCKKGTPVEAIESLVLQTLERYHVSLHAIKQIASIDLKAKEEGLLIFCKRYHLPLITNTSEELASLMGDFTPSTFVKSVTGVDNVCERAALYQEPKGFLIIRKTASNGVTIAAALQDYTIDFGGN